MKEIFKNIIHNIEQGYLYSVSECSGFGCFEINGQFYNATPQGLHQRDEALDCELLATDDGDIEGSITS